MQWVDAIDKGGARAVHMKRLEAALTGEFPVPCARLERHYVRPL
jgi:hypothetical protein